MATAMLRTGIYLQNSNEIIKNSTKCVTKYKIIMQIEEHKSVIVCIKICHSCDLFVIISLVWFGLFYSIELLVGRLNKSITH